jgi:hypothetical protein
MGIRLSGRQAWISLPSAWWDVETHSYTALMTAQLTPAAFCPIISPGGQTERAIAKQFLTGPTPCLHGTPF